MASDGIRFYIYQYNASTREWDFDDSPENYMDWSPKPRTVGVVRRVEWRTRSSGTKQFKSSGGKADK